MELPDLKGRKAILKVHAKRIKVAEDVDFGVIACMGSGFFHGCAVVVHRHLPY